jgi:hypothetical protein
VELVERTVGGDANVSCRSREKERKEKRKLAVKELLALWRKKEKQSMERRKV